MGLEARPQGPSVNGHETALRLFREDHTSRRRGSVQGLICHLSWSCQQSTDRPVSSRNSLNFFAHRAGKKPGAEVSVMRRTIAGSISCLPTLCRYGTVDPARRRLESW